MKSLISAASRWCVCVIFVLVSIEAMAVPASPFSFSDVQPDGSRIVLHVRGDEHFNWNEDTDGFTVVRDSNRRYVYARRGADGRLEATGFEVGKANPRAIGLTRRVLPSPAVVLQSRLTGSTAVAGEAAANNVERVAPLGQIKNMVIVIRFADHTGRSLPSAGDIDTLFNAVGGDAQLAPTGSVKDVYLENSYGQMTLNSTIFGWVDVPNSEAYYANGQSGDSTLWEALRFALDIVDQSVNFDDFDTDNDGFIDAIAFIHSGYGAEWGGTDAFGASTANRIWSHRWAIQPAWQSSEGVRVFDYHISPGVWGTSGSEIGRVGVIAHETGHFFGLPDLYDTQGTGAGIGSFGMMANSWGFDGSQLFPPHFSPWSKEILGWITPTILTSPGTYQLPEAEFNASVFRIDSGYPQDEYLLVENRQPTGFDGSMPQGGLVIWHIDDQAPHNNEGYPGQSGWPGNGNHYRVAVLQADGQYHLEKDSNRGDAGDVYHGGGVTEISSTTVPNSDAYQNGNIIVTGNAVSAISAAGANMSFTFGQPAPGPSVAIADHVTTYGNVSGSYSNTHSDDDIYEIVTEVHSGGRKSSRHDRLEHIWRFTPASTDNRFNVSAWRTDGGDADNGFVFESSANANGPWTAMATVTKTADDDQYQSFTLGTVPSTIYVRVRDNNRSSGQRSADSIHIDHMYFDEGAVVMNPPGPATNPAPGNNATGVNLDANVAWSAGADTANHDVYFGATSLPPLVSQQSGTGYDPGTLNENTTYFWRIDEVNNFGTTAGSLWSFTTGASGPQCAAVGQSCSTNSDCCSNKCKGGRNKACR